MHIYETEGIWDSKSFDNWGSTSDTYRQRYIELMDTYRGKVLLEVTGHDHLTGIRHSTTDAGDFFLNKVLFPGMTASSET